MHEGQSIAEGPPYAPSVRKLCETYGSQPKGTNIPHHEIEEIINLKRGQQRYHAIAGRWKHTMREEYSLVVRSVPKYGYHICDDPDALRESGRDIKHVRKTAARAYQKAAVSDELNLTDNQKRARQHALLYTSRIEGDAKTGARHISAHMGGPPPAKSLPQRPVPDGEGTPGE